MLYLKRGIKHLKVGNSRNMEQSKLIAEVLPQKKLTKLSIIMLETE